MDPLITAEEWFSLGTRVPYDPAADKVGRPDEATDVADALRVFERVVRADTQDDAAVWTTFLAGFPDGSYGWASVDQHLRGDEMVPKLFVEFVGQ